jgi:1-acyl-sn-glycerol-3-phosphate acyltransferase
MSSSDEANRPRARHTPPPPRARRTPPPRARRTPPPRAAAGTSSGGAAESARRSPATSPARTDAGRTPTRGEPIAHAAVKPVARAAPRRPTETLAPVIPLASRSSVRRDAAPVRPELPPGPVRPRAGWEERAVGALAFARRRITGAYEVDEFGFDPDLADHVAVPAFRPLFEKWFRTEVHGIENVPVEGGALLVANHGGAIWALDAVMTAIAVHDRTPNQRYLRMLGADLIFSTPVLGPFARKTGSTLACQPDAERLLRNGELVGVWPEGFKGIGKPFHERYKLQRFGRGGFVTAALHTGVPIIPVSIVGAEEIHPMLFNAATLARVMGLPYFPVTPTFPWLGPLGLVPLPSKWHIEFGAPIDTAELGPDAADDPLVTFELTDRVRETIQSTLYRLLALRTSPWN